ncbi:MAG: 6-bladed beta-propeller [Stellaceae bacterium]
MPLTTVARGRVYDWSHSVGRTAARGTGYNYPQMIRVGKGSAVFATNRGNENNFGMHANKVYVAGPGEEDLLAEFFDYGEADGNCTWPFGIAVDNDRDHIYCSDEWTNTISVFDSSGKFVRKWGKAGSGDGELSHPAGLAVEKSGNVIVADAGNNRLQVFTPEGKFVGKCGKAGSGEGEFNQPWGVTVDKDGNIFVADWKNHRVQKLDGNGRFLMKIGEYGTITPPENAYAVTTYGPYVSAMGETVGYPRPDLLNHPTDVAVDTDGDIYITDWGNHRVCTFDSEGGPIAHLIGDAQVLSKWAQQTIDANPDMAKARRRVRSLEPQWRFCFPTSVAFDPATDNIIVADSQRQRLQVYKKVRNYSDFQANL